MSDTANKVTRFYIILFVVIISVYHARYLPYIGGEWDDYSLPTASILNEFDLAISQNDVNKHKEIFPEWASHIDSFTGSDYHTDDGQEITWYFPLYSIIAIPMVVLLDYLKNGFPAIFAYPFTNILCLATMLFIVYRYLKIRSFPKLILILTLSVNPVLFYVGWVSAEVTIYSLIGIALTFWYNKWFKRAAITISLAGMLNPTVMVIGMGMVCSFFFYLYRKKDNSERMIPYFVAHITTIIKYLSCYLIVLIPFIYNYYYSGNINLTAGRFGSGSIGDTLNRAVAYIFDLNYGIMPYYSPLLIISLILAIVAFFRRQWGYIFALMIFLGTVVVYSFMMHINHGMSGIARYNAWSVVILIFATGFFYDKLYVDSKYKKHIAVALICSLVYTAVITYSYGVYIAQNTHSFHMTPIARAVLNHIPSLYNPLYSTFNTRINHVDGGYDYENRTPIVYVDDNGYIKKILASAKDIDYILAQYVMLDGDHEWFVSKVNKLKEKPQYISIPSKIKLVRANEYRLGDVISFYGDNYNIDKYISSGLSHKEEYHSWSVGKYLKFNAKIVGDKSDLYHFKMNLGGVFNGKQRVNIYINENNVFSGTIVGAEPIEFDFSVSDDDDVISVVMHIPDAISPVDIGFSDDRRELGLAIRDITIYSVN